MNTFFDHLSASLKIAKNNKKPLYIRVKIIPKSPKNEVVEQMEDDTYKIRIAAPATDNKANIELIKFLQKSLKAEVAIVSGQKDRIKLIKISN